MNGSNLGRAIIIRAIRIAPAFQNFCMGIYRDSCRKVVEPEREMAIEPCVEAIEQLCGHMPRGSLLRSLTVDTLSYENPSQMNKRGGPAWEKWRSLLTGQISNEAWSRDFQEDFVVEAGRNWNGIPPVSAFLDSLPDRDTNATWTTKDDLRCV